MAERESTYAYWREEGEKLGYDGDELLEFVKRELQEKLAREEKKEAEKLAREERKEAEKLARE